MFCYRCGAPYEKTKFCPNCGVLLEEVEEYDRAVPVGIEKQSVEAMSLEVAEKQERASTYQLEVMDTQEKLPAQTEWEKPQSIQAPNRARVNLYNTSATTNQVSQTTTNVNYIDNSMQVNNVNMGEQSPMPWQQMPYRPPAQQQVPQLWAEQPLKYAPLSIASFVVGLVGLISSSGFLGGVMGIVGVALGIVALRRLNPQAEKGKGLAIAGIVLAALAFLI